MKFSRDLLNIFEIHRATLENFREGSGAPLTIENSIDNKNTLTDCSLPLEFRYRFNIVIVSGAIYRVA